MKLCRRFENSKTWIAVFLFLIFPSVNACSPVMFGVMGTNYDKKINRDSSREELHKLFGEPISAETYSTPPDSKNIQATWPCCRFLLNCSAVDNPEQRSRKITGFEVFRIKGVVRSHHTSSAQHFLLVDIMTFGVAEFFTFPYATTYWIDENRIEKEKDMTVWYGANNTFEGGEIRYSRTNKFITFVPDCLRPDFRK